jgi:hypothetical protein
LRAAISEYAPRSPWNATRLPAKSVIIVSLL